MKTPFRSIVLAGILVSGLAVSTSHATTTTTTVAGDQGPWEQATNPTLAYGRGDNQPPLSLSTGFDFAAGGVFTIAYQSGATTNGLGGASYDANGQTSYVTNHNTGNSGHLFPSAYIPTSSYPTYLSQLVGAFADASGTVVGSPFIIGDNPVSETVGAAGVTQLLLGINDDIFSDNSGSLTVEVAGPSSTSAAPEPSTWWLMIVGIGGAGLMLRRATKAGSAEPEAAPTR